MSMQWRHMAHIRLKMNTLEWIVCMTLCLGCILLSPHSASGTITNRELVELILGNISGGGMVPLRPVQHPSDKLKVYVGSALYQIVDLNQRNNLATISAYFDVQWHDSQIHWDPSLYDNISIVHVPAKEVWIPEFYLYHSVDGSTPLLFPDSTVMVKHTGEMRAFVPFTARALCPINVKYFPFDEQTCRFKFGSWSYTTEAIEYVVASNEVYLNDFFDNQEWLLTDSSLTQDALAYEMNVTEQFHETYSMVVMTLHLKRQSFYYVFNLVCPVTLVSIVAVSGFHMPMFSVGLRTSKYRLGIITLLSMGVMLLMLVDDMPKFARESIPGQRGSFSDVPLLGIFYLALICNISMSTCFAEVFLILERYAFKHPHAHQVPSYLRWLQFHWSDVFYRLLHRRPRISRNFHLTTTRQEREHKHTQEILLSALPNQPPPNGDCFKESKHSLQSSVNASILPDITLRRLHEVLDELSSLLREVQRDVRLKRLPEHWAVVINRLERCSLAFFLSIIFCDVLLLYFHEYVY